MTLDDIALIAEIAAALAIFVSLIFVGIQVRDNTKAARLNAASEAARSLQEFYLVMGSSAEASMIVAKSQVDPNALTPTERVQFSTLLNAFFTAQQHYFYAFEQGLLDPSIKTTLMMPVRGLADNPGLKMYWRQRKGHFRPEFRAEVDRILEEGSGSYDVFWDDADKSADT